MCLAFFVSGSGSLQHQRLDSNSHPEHMFSHSCQQTLKRDSQAGSYSATLISSNTLESHSQAGCISSQWFRSAQTRERNSLAESCSVFSISGTDQLKHRRATHILYVFPIYLVNKIHVHFLLSYRFVLLKKIMFQLICIRKCHIHTASIPSANLINKILYSHSKPHVNPRTVQVKIIKKWFHMALFLLSFC